MKHIIVVLSSVNKALRGVYDAGILGICYNVAYVGTTELKWEGQYKNAKGHCINQAFFKGHCINQAFSEHSMRALTGRADCHRIAIEKLNYWISVLPPGTKTPGIPVRTKVAFHLVLGDVQIDNGLPTGVSIGCDKVVIFNYNRTFCMYMVYTGGDGKTYYRDVNRFTVNYIPHSHTTQAIDEESFHLVVVDHRYFAVYLVTVQDDAVTVNRISYFVKNQSFQRCIAASGPDMFAICEYDPNREYAWTLKSFPLFFSGLGESVTFNLPFSVCDILVFQGFFVVFGIPNNDRSWGARAYAIANVVGATPQYSGCSKLYDVGAIAKVDEQQIAVCSRNGNLCIFRITEGMEWEVVFHRQVGVTDSVVSMKACNGHIILMDEIMRCTVVNRVDYSVKRFLDILAIGYVEKSPRSLEVIVRKDKKDVLAVMVDNRDGSCRIYELTI